VRPWIIFIPVASAVAVLLACSKGVSTAPPPDVDSGTEDDVVFGDDAAPEAQPDGEGEGDGGGDGQVDASAPDAAACDASSVDGGRVVAYAPLSLRSTYDFTSIDYSIVTHVVEHAVCTNGNGTLNLTNLGGTFPIPNLVQDVHAGGAKAILGLCGDPGSTDEFAEMASGATSRAAFINNVMALIAEYDFDGIDLDWEYPSNASDESKLTKLVSELRTALGPTLSISIAGPNNDGIAQYYDLPSLLPNLDWFAVQTYDYSDPKTSATAYPASPLYSTGNKGSVDKSIQYYLGKGVASDKLLIGLPFAGKLYEGATMLGEHLTSHKGDSSVAYSDVVPLVGAGWDPHRDDVHDAPYLLRTDGTDGVLVYDDPASIETKCNYAACNRLGGTILWYLGEDVVGGSQPLLQAARACR
jgi:chitinase